MSSDQNEPLTTLIHYKSIDGRGDKSLEHEVVKPGSSSAMFLQRMEFNRLSRPTQQIIDMRGKVDDDVYEYEYLKKNHFMDSRCIEIFENEVSAYGELTVGVIEAVTQAAHTHRAKAEREYQQRLREKERQEALRAAEIAARQQREAQQQGRQTGADVTPPERPAATETESDQQLKPVGLIPFGYNRHRREIRMTFITPAEIIDENRVTIQAKTMDISASGARIKTSDPALWKEGDSLDICYPVIYQRIGRTFTACHYQIVETYQEGKFTVARLTTVLDNDDNPTTFASELGNFIEANKRRYKIDFEDFTEALTAKVFENIYVQSLTYAPLLFTEENNRSVLKYVVFNHACNILQSPIAEQVLSELSSRLDKTLIEQALTQQEDDSYSDSSSGIYLYAFTTARKESEGQLYWALESEFSSDMQKHQFLELAMSYKTFRAWKLQLSPVVLPATKRLEMILPELESISSDDAATLQEEMSQVHLVGALIDIRAHLVQPEQSEHSEDLATLEQVLFPFKSDPTNSKRFERIKLGQKKQRSERRYFLTTLVRIKLGGKTYQGESIDFSPGGIKVHFDQKVGGSTRDFVDLDLIGLQKKFRKESLTKQPYRIAHISHDGRTVSFARDHRYTDHTASRFFRKLIESNLDKLGQCSGDVWMVSRSAIVETIVCQSLMTLPFFVNGRGRNPAIDSLALCEKPPVLLWFFNHHDEYDFMPIMQADRWQTLLENSMADNGEFVEYYETEIYIFREPPTASHPERFQSAIREDFSSRSECNAYIRDLVKHEDYRFLKLSIAPAFCFEEALIDDEIREIRSNSRTRATTFLERLRNTRVVLELVDITRLVSLRVNH